MLIQKINMQVIQGYFLKKNFSLKISLVVP